LTIEVVDVEVEKLNARYAAAMHAMQSGVAMEMQVDERKSATEPKHLRVGINSAMVNDAALATLLVKKGIITEREYLEAVVEEAEKERASYEARLTAHFGKTITLA
jgi:hypothetical protein